ncbi:MAG: hypothetical protein KCHDKBKB_00538 [Elusimicrobia bacterium]|nr:hypothetical protein [Elusimicrobiota bacterium]
MRRYLLSSAGIHFSILLLFFFFTWLNRGKNLLIIDGFEFIGDGGGGDGRPGGGGPKAAHMGQVVPAPVRVPIPQKPGPVQKPTKTEETWKVKDPKKIPEKPKTTTSPDTPIETAETNQIEKSNIIRRGVDPNTKAGEGGFDFGTGEGGGGEGDGKGMGIGIGYGPGEGGGFGGFGGYLRILRQRIWAEWSQSAVYGSNEVCIVGLTVSKDGQVTDIKVEKPSNNSFYDNVALRAVRNSSPLPPLPASFSKSSQRFRIKFRLLE